MLHRQIRRLTERCAAFVAVIGILLFAFAAPGTHAPQLHSPTSAQDNTADNIAANHSHDDHSHDDDEASDHTASGNTATDHHHADHTHEKAGLVTTADALSRTPAPSVFQAITPRLAGNPPDGIHRPPRHSVLI